MKLKLYEIGVKEDFLYFEFISEGPKGRITKVVQYTKTNMPNLYNLGFGDKNPITGNIDDKVITNNGDSQKVLATVAATVDIILTHYPNAWIYAIGTNKARTRLYRMTISNNIDIILPILKYWG